jgi:hypothetical protein
MAFLFGNADDPLALGQMVAGFQNTTLEIQDRAPYALRLSPGYIGDRSWVIGDSMWDER